MMAMGLDDRYDGCCSALLDAVISIGHGDGHLWTNKEGRSASGTTHRSMKMGPLGLRVDDDSFTISDIHNVIRTVFSFVGFVLWR